MKESKGKIMVIQDNLVNWMEKVQENLAQQIVPFGEYQSPKKQMAAFKDMQPEDRARMTEEKGPEKTEEFLSEMLQRQAASDKQRRPM